MTKYKDPSNTEEIIKDLKEMETMGDVYKLIKQTFPDWIVTTMPSFCNGYPHLNHNWFVLCKRIGVKPSQIVIVRELSMNDECKLLKTFIECLTRSGFSVRSMTDYIPCIKCEIVAVPTPQVHNVMKSKNLEIPDVNTMVCHDCRNSASLGETKDESSNES